MPNPLDLPEHEPFLGHFDLVVFTASSVVAVCGLRSRSGPDLNMPPQVDFRANLARGLLSREDQSNANVVCSLFLAGDSIAPSLMAVKQSGLQTLAVKLLSGHSWAPWSGPESIPLFLVDPQCERSGGVPAHFRDESLHLWGHLFEWWNWAAIAVRENDWRRRYSEGYVR